MHLPRFPVKPTGLQAWLDLAWLCLPYHMMLLSNLGDNLTSEKGDEVQSERSGMIATARENIDEYQWVSMGINGY